MIRYFRVLFLNTGNNSLLVRLFHRYLRIFLLRFNAQPTLPVVGRFSVKYTLEPVLRLLTRHDQNHGSFPLYSYR